jgi:hypothetical protein
MSRVSADRVSAPADEQPGLTLVMMVASHERFGEMNRRRCRIQSSKFITTPQQDGEALVLGLNMLLTSGSRPSTFAVARTETIEKITGAKLQSEMLEAIDLLEKQFTLKQ